MRVGLFSFLSLVSVLTRREKLLVWLHETVAFWSLSRVASAHAFTLTCTHAEKLVSSFIPIRLSLSPWCCLCMCGAIIMWCFARRAREWICGKKAQPKASVFAVCECRHVIRHTAACGGKSLPFTRLTRGKGKRFKWARCKRQRGLKGQFCHYSCQLFGFLIKMRTERYTLIYASLNYA